MQAGSSFVSRPKPWGIVGCLRKGCGQGWSAKGTERPAQCILQAGLPQDCVSRSRLCLPASRAPGLRKHTAPLSLWEASPDCPPAAVCSPHPELSFRALGTIVMISLCSFFFFLNTCVPHTRSDVSRRSLPQCSHTLSEDSLNS